MFFCIIICSKIIESSFQMPHPRAKVCTQMPHPWDVLDKQMPRGGPGGGGWARLDLTHALFENLADSLNPEF